MAAMVLTVVFCFVSGMTYSQQVLTDNVTMSPILEDNVTTSPILQENVTTSPILQDNITMSSIWENHVTTSHILDAIQQLRDDFKGVEEKLDICLLGAGSTPSTTTTMPLWEHVCEDSYVKFEDHCYYFDTTKRDWSAARGACQSKGSYLVSVNSQAEQDFLVSNIRNNETQYWMGMYWMSAQRLMWMDGTYVNYTAWGFGEPNCMRSNCKSYLSPRWGYNWEDARRSYNFFSICETDKLIRIQHRPTTTTTTAKPAVCPPGFGGFEGHCYLLELDRVPWSRANEECKKLGSYLVSINSDSEQKFLMKQIIRRYEGDEPFWLGMHSNVRGKLLWDDGTDVNYTAWKTGPPTCMQNGCKPLFSKYMMFKWTYVSYKSYMSYYICERDHLPPVDTSSVGRKSTE